MSDFLDRVVKRASGHRPVLEPRISSRYAPPEHHLVAPEAPAPLETGAGAGPAEMGQGRTPEPGREAEPDDRAPDARAGQPPSVPRAAPDGSVAMAGQHAVERPVLRDDASDGLAPSPPRAEAPPRHAHDARTDADLSSIAAAEPLREVSGPEQAAPPAAPRGPAAARARRDGGQVSPRPPAEVVAAQSPPGAGAADQIEDAFWNFLYGSSEPAAAPSLPGGPREDAFWNFLYGSSEPAAAPSLPGGPRGDGPGGLQPAPLAPDMTGREAAGGRRSAAAVAVPSEPQEITVAIERIDVRGLAPPPPPAAAAPARRGPRLSLEDYMRQSGSVRSRR